MRDIEHALLSMEVLQARLSSSGCVVGTICSCTISLGGRSTQGVARRSAFQFLSKRHRIGSSQQTLPSMSTNLRDRNCVNTLL